MFVDVLRVFHLLAAAVWVGGTVAAKVGTINLDAMAVYGQRQLFSASNSATGLGPELVEESGFGVWVTARVPIGPLSTRWHGWYTTGDIATLDEDGFLAITDRLSRFSKIGGEMVPHIKVEEKLHELAGRTEQTFAVCGVPDERKGERAGGDDTH